MKQRIKVPPLGEGVTTATIVEWGYDVGDTVVAGEVLVAVELDKIDTDIPSPVGGTLVERHGDAGDEVEVGQVIAVVDA